MDQEKAYQSLFYLHQIRPTSVSQRFAWHNRLVEAHFINRSNADSLTCWIKLNEQLLPQVTNKKEIQYFHYCKALLHSLNDQPKAVQELASLITSDARITAFGWLRTGDWLQLLGKHDASLAAFEKALTYFKTDSARFYIKLFRTRYFRAIGYKSMSRYAQAKSDYTICLSILDKVPENLWSERARVLNNLGNVYNETGAYGLARQCYENSLRLKEKYLPDSLSNAITYLNLGTFFSNYANFSQAREYYAKAFDLMPRPKNAQAQTRLNALSSNFSGVLREFGEFAKSKQIVDAALQSSSKNVANNDPSVLRLMLRSAEDAISLNEQVQAKRLMEKIGSQITEWSADERFTVEYSMTLMNFLFEAKQYDSCLRVCDFLLQPNKPNVKVHEIYYAYVKKGNCLEKLESVDAAIHPYKQSFSLANNNGLTMSAVEALDFLSTVYFKLTQLDSAENYAQQSIQLNRINSINSQPFIGVDAAISCFTRLAAINFLRYQTTSKVAFLTKATEQTQTALQLIKDKRQALQFEIDQYEFGDYVAEVFERATDIYFEAWRLGVVPFNQLLELVETNKAQILLSNLNRQAVSRFAGVTDAIQKREETLRQRERDITFDLDAQLTKSSPINTELKQEKQALLVALRNEKQNFLDSLSSNLPNYFELKYNQTVTDVNMLLDILPESAIIVEFARGQHNYYALIISPGKALALKLPVLSDIDKQVTLLRNQIRFKVDQISNTERMLYNQLVQPVDSVIQYYNWRTRELIIIPDGPLTLLPFELLKDQGKRSRFLLEQYAIFYNYSATLYWQKSTDKNLAPGKNLAAFAPVFTDVYNDRSTLRDELDNSLQFTNLPETIVEAKFIAGLYEQRKLGTGRVYHTDAHESVFKRLPFDQYGVLHLATHGFAGLAGNKHSGVAFGRGSTEDDDILFTEEIYDLKMPVELVTLSACETGLGKYYAGEGLVGLTRAFFYAGARSVLVSMWKVEDKSTAELMKGFYHDYLGMGKPKSIALRAAKLKMIKNEKYSHPYYWSSFVLLGAN